MRVRSVANDLLMMQSFNRPACRGCQPQLVSCPLDIYLSAWAGRCFCSLNPNIFLSCFGWILNANNFIWGQMDSSRMQPGKDFCCIWWWDLSQVRMGASYQAKVQPVPFLCALSGHSHNIEKLGICRVQQCSDKILRHQKCASYTTVSAVTQSGVHIAFWGCLTAMLHSNVLMVLSIEQIR